MPPKSRKVPNKTKSSKKPTLRKEKPSTGRDAVDISLIQTGKRVRRPRIMDDGLPVTITEIMALSTVSEEEEEGENTENAFEPSENDDEDIDMSVVSSNSQAMVTSEDDEVVSKDVMKKKSAGRPKIWYNQVIRLRCPEFNEGKKELEWTTSRLDIDLDDWYRKVLGKIFVTVGCDDLKEERLPTVKIHFSKDKKDQEFRLENEKDWEVIKSEWKVEAAKKKEGAYGAVILSKEFMNNLRQSKLIHRHKKPQHEKAANEVRAKIDNNTGPGKAKKNKAGANFIDIYASDEDFSMTRDAVFDAEAGYDASFQRLEDELLANLRACGVCNPLPRPDGEKKMCFLTKYGQHRYLSLIQVREWVEALVAKEHPSKYPHKHVNLDKVTFKTPPDIPSFQEFLNPPPPGIKGRIMQALPVRSNRQEVNTSKLAPEMIPAIPQINVTPQIFLPPMNHHGFETPMSKYKHMETPSFSPGDTILPTVDEWLASLNGPAVGKVDIQAVREKFEMAAFSLFPLDILEDYKISTFGPNGKNSILTHAEEALLSYKLKKTMNQFRKAKEGKGQ